MINILKNLPFLLKMFMLVLVIYVPTEDEDNYGTGHYFLWETDYSIQPINYFAQLCAGAILCLILINSLHGLKSIQARISQAIHSKFNAFPVLLQKFIKSEFVLFTVVILVISTILIGADWIVNNF